MNASDDILPPNASDDVLLTAPKVCKRYGGRSDMWLWRQLRNDPDFPKPLLINGRRYWWLSRLRRYEAAKASVGAA
jgi:predicted DNA-binding transcriptional regulator AlpA